MGMKGPVKTIFLFFEKWGCPGSEVICGKVSLRVVGLGL